MPFYLVTVPPCMRNTKHKGLGRGPVGGRRKKTQDFHGYRRTQNQRQARGVILAQTEDDRARTPFAAQPIGQLPGRQETAAYQEFDLCVADLLPVGGFEGSGCQ